MFGYERFLSKLLNLVISEKIQLPSLNIADKFSENWILGDQCIRHFQFFACYHVLDLESVDHRLAPVVVVRDHKDFPALPAEVLDPVHPLIQLAF